MAPGATSKVGPAPTPPRIGVCFDCFGASCSALTENHGAVIGKPQVSPGMAGALVGALETVLTGREMPASEERVKRFTRSRFLASRLLAGICPTIAGSILESVARHFSID